MRSRLNSTFPSHHVLTNGLKHPQNKNYF